MHAYAPNGELIKGALETINGACPIDQDSCRRNEQGELTFDYKFPGGTEVFDDSWAPRRADNGQRLFICEGGQVWREDQIVLKPK